MTEFSVIEAGLKRVALIAAASVVTLLVTTIAALAFAYRTAREAHELQAHTPILVVPGAVGGVYTPGLTAESIRATARYLTGLATSFSGTKSMQERFDELETFSSPQFLPRLQQARVQLQRVVDAQNQSRAFFGAPQSEDLRQSDTGRFDYEISGQRQIFASGLPMNNHQSLVRLKLVLGQASSRNRAGVILDGLDVTDLSPQGSTQPAQSAPPATGMQP
jgi:hypothetical protein